VPYIPFVVFPCCRIYGSAVVRVGKRPEAATGLAAVSGSLRANTVRCLRCGVAEVEAHQMLERNAAM